jgi:hypothetical protein
VNGVSTISTPVPANRATEVAQPLETPDYLAGALLQSLMRPFADRYVMGLVKTGFLAVVSFGVLPLILLPRKLREFAARERDQLWHLAQWMRVQFGADAEALQPRSPALDRFVHLLRLISWGSAAVAIVIIVSYVSGAPRGEDLARATYGYFRHPHYGYREVEQLFAVWTISLCIGYSAHWFAVLAHQARVRNFISDFNELAQRKGVRPMMLPPEVLGFSVVWLFGGFILMKCGAFWGLPLALAGAAQTRYIKSQARTTRAQLAERVREVLSATRPQMLVPVPVVLRRKCPVSLCQAPLPPTATYCPRCGMRVAAVDRVA